MSEIAPARKVGATMSAAPDRGDGQSRAAVELPMELAFDSDNDDGSGASCSSSVLVTSIREHLNRRAAMSLEDRFMADALSTETIPESPTPPSNPRSLDDEQPSGAASSAVRRLYQASHAPARESLQHEQQAPAPAPSTRGVAAYPRVAAAILGALLLLAALMGGLHDDVRARLRGLVRGPELEPAAAPAPSSPPFTPVAGVDEPAPPAAPHEHDPPPSLPATVR